MSSTITALSPRIEVAVAVSGHFKRSFVLVAFKGFAADAIAGIATAPTV